MKFYDAHNHLQDDRLRPHLDGVIAAVRAIPITRMVVNGSCEEDWPEVLKLAREFPEVLPSFGYHPWYVKERTSEWRERLVEFLNQVPSAVGEVGLDRWIKDHDIAQQQEVFEWQLRLAAERELPVSIHCIQAWGLLLSILQRGPVSKRGFLLHSYGGSVEMIPDFVKLGAYFSFPGYYAQEKKLRQREIFRSVPRDRLLIETDAPDQPLPNERNHFPLLDSAGKPINHPANLAAVYEFVSEWLGETPEALASRVEGNFLRLFE
ncbi:MAG TPA: TatD family hydrolase [Verrucomicrobiae bacterium]|jgi:TatD DNase family protein